jgi:hypothetical protein
VTPRRAVLLLAVVAAGLAGCAGNSTAITDPPLCRSGGTDVGNGVILMAQSVPSASWVPCIRTALPLGWTFHHLVARNGDARFWLDSDRDGTQAIEVALTKTCDTSGSTEIPSDREGMRRLERVRRVSPTYAGERFYLFPGGCLTVVFRLGGDSSGEALALASQAVGAVRRADVDAQVREESGGRLSLDPAAEGTGGR